jgi:hypothetical protein
MTSRRAAEIADAKPNPWAEGKQPDPSQAELRHREAGREYADATRALEGWTGKRDKNDEAYAKVLKRYHDAIAEHNAAGCALPREQEIAK